MSQEHVFYWRKKGGKKEVDFVIKDKNGDLLPIEVKYQNQINSKDYTGLSSFKKGILISKKDFNATGNYVTS
jgi:predicted AAA+ superfamily ATPase